jgi:hypothetical protein
MSVSTHSVVPGATSPPATGFVQGLGLFDCVMIVAGAMIGSGIFIVPAAMAREIGSSGGLLLAWVFAGALTIAAARRSKGAPLCSFCVSETERRDQEEYPLVRAPFCQNNYPLLRNRAVSSCFGGRKP